MGSYSGEYTLYFRWIIIKIINIMNVQLNYEEILSYVENKYHVKPTISAVNDSTLSIAYKKNAFVPTVTVDVHVDEVSKESVVLSYNCFIIVAGLLKGSIHLIEEKIPKHEIEISTDERKIYIHLDAIKQLEKVLEFVVPTSISFDEKAVNVSLTLQG